MDSTSRVNIYINNEEGRKALYQLEEAYRKNTEALNQLTASGKKNTEQAKALRAENDRLTKAMQEQKRQIGITALSYSELKKEYQAVYREWSKALPGTEHRDALKKQLDEIREQLDTTGLSSKKSAQAFEQGALKIDASNLLVTLSTKGAKSAFSALWTTIKANPIGLVLTGIAALSKVVDIMEQKMKSFNAQAEVTAQINEKVGESTVEESTKIRLLHQALTDNNLSLEKRRDALKQLQAIVPEYHASLTETGRLVGDNTEALDDYIEKLKAKALAEAYAAEYARLTIERERQAAELAQKTIQQTIDRSGARGPWAALKAFWNQYFGDYHDQVEQFEKDTARYQVVSENMQQAFNTSLTGGDGTQTRESIEAVFSARREAIEENLQKELNDIEGHIMKVTARIELHYRKGILSHEQYLRQLGYLDIDVADMRRKAQEKHDDEMEAAEKERQTGTTTLRQKDYESAKKQLDSHLAQQILSVKQSLADGRTTQQQADTEIKSLKARHLNSLLELQKEYGQDTAAIQTQIAEASVQAREEAYRNESERLKQHLDRTRLELRAGLLSRKIDQQQHDDALLFSEETYYKGLLALQKRYGKDTLDTENNLLTVREKTVKRSHEKVAQNIERLSQTGRDKVSQWINRQQRAFTRLEQQSDTLFDHLQQGWDNFSEWAEKSGNPYARMAKDIKDQMEQVQDAFKKMKDALKNGFDITPIAEFVAQATTSIGTSLNAILESENQIALQQENARYNKAKSNLAEYYNQAIASAQDNEEEQQRLREEYSRKKEQLDYQTAVKKLEIEKKQAKATFAINVAMATAQAAAAVVQCFATVPFPASIPAAALVGATTALQIRAMKAQRDAILSQSIEAPNLSSSRSASTDSSSTGTTTRQITAPQRTEYVRGYQDGGYTDVIRTQDGRRYRAAVHPDQRGYVDRPTLLVGERGGEFVASAEAVNNPRIRPVFDIIDQAQRRGTVGRLNMRAIARSLGSARVRGYAGGGYTDGKGSGGFVFGDSAPVLAQLGQIHEDILQLKEAIRTDHRAYVVLSDLTAMQQKLETAKNLARL